MLPGVELEYTWGGALCLSRNGGAPFGEIAPAVFSAVGCNGLGLTRGTIGGKLIAEYALGINSELLEILLQQPKPIANPPEPLLGIGVRSTLMWKEWQAGIEL
jgi:glycine/D-amino acid oxidase-like deaminating enzyme